MRLSELKEKVIEVLEKKGDLEVNISDKHLQVLLLVDKAKVGREYGEERFVIYTHPEDPDIKKLCDLFNRPQIIGL